MSIDWILIESKPISKRIRFWINLREVTYEGGKLVNERSSDPEPPGALLYFIRAQSSQIDCKFKGLRKRQN